MSGSGPPSGIDQAELVLLVLAGTDPVKAAASLTSALVLLALRTANDEAGAERMVARMAETLALMGGPGMLRHLWKLERPEG